MNHPVASYRLMRRFARLMVVGLTVVLFAVGAFTAPRAWAQRSLPITIGYQDTPDWLFFVARDLKLFEKAGLAPSYVKFPGGPPMIAATQNGSIDLASVGSVAFVVGLSQGLDWVMIGINPEGAYSQGLVARRDSGIRTPADLRGKRIGLFNGTNAQFGLMMILRQHGIRPDQVTMLNMPPEEQMLALENKKIDAAMVWEPWMQRMVHGAGGRIISTEGNIGIYTNVDGYTVRRQWLVTHRETAVRFLRALLRAQSLIRQRPELVPATLRGRFPEVNESDLATILAHSRFELGLSNLLLSSLRQEAAWLEQRGEPRDQRVRLRNVVSPALLEELAPGSVTLLNIPERPLR